MIFFILIYLFFSVDVFGFDGGVIDTIINGVFFHKYSYLWFILQLIYIFIFITPIISHIRSIKISTIILILLFVYSNLVYFLDFPMYIDVFFIHVRVYCVFFFYFGSYVAMYFSEWIKKCKISKIRIFLSLILMLFAYVLHITKIRGLELFITILPAWFLFEISNLLVVYDNPIPLAKYSFPIYVMHQLILEPIQYLMGITENSSDFIVLVGYYSSVAMTLIIIICFVKILRKYCPIFGELLFGRGRI